MQHLAELAHRVLVTGLDRQDSDLGNAGRKDDPESGIVSPGPKVGRDVEGLKSCKETGADKLGVRRDLWVQPRENPIQHRLENPPIDHRVEPFQRIALIGNLAWAVGQGEEGKLGGTDEFRH